MVRECLTVVSWEEKGRLSGEGKNDSTLGVTQRGGSRETESRIEV